MRWFLFFFFCIIIWDDLSSLFFVWDDFSSFFVFQKKKNFKNLLRISVWIAHFSNTWVNFTTYHFDFMVLCVVKSVDVCPCVGEIYRWYNQSYWLHFLCSQLLHPFIEFHYSKTTQETLYMVSLFLIPK